MKNIIDQGAPRIVDLSESGLLWLFNTAVLHPRGFALAMDTNSRGTFLLFGDGSEPVRFADDMDKVCREKFAAVEALLSKWDTPATEGPQGPVADNVHSLPPRPEHHEGSLALSGEGNPTKPVTIIEHDDDEEGTD